MRVYGEYSGHMFVYLVNPAYKGADSADVEINAGDRRQIINVIAIILGLLGF